jgi:hypothetical protein
VSVKVVVHASKPWESTVDNPLGEGVPHRMWTWSDGSWLLIRFYDDGVARATTSPGITATLDERDDVLRVQISPVRRALQRQSTAENQC